MKQLVLVRHGESEWNKLNLFTGWTDVELSPKGIEEAKSAGELLKKEGFEFDVCYTSYLKRAIHTAHLIEDAMDLAWIPEIRTWKLNERHYGALQGLNKAETAEKFGEEQVTKWRRSYDIAPPELTEDDKRNPAKESRYAANPPEGKPLTESLKITVNRVIPFYEEVIKPEIEDGQRVIVVAHGNSLRALVKHLDNLTGDEIVKVNIPTGSPLVYEFDDSMNVIGSRYLGDMDAIAAKQKAVSEQGKRKRFRNGHIWGTRFGNDNMGCKVEVDPGVCKMKTVVVAKTADDFVSVKFDTESDCPHVRELGATVGNVDPYTAVSAPFPENQIYVAAGKCLPHAACPVPCAMVKAMEVAAGLGLKRDVSLKITDAPDE